MIEILQYLILLLFSFFIFKWLFRFKINPYSNKFWGFIEMIWLIVAFTGVSIGLYELNKIKDQFAYKEMEEGIQSEYQEDRACIYGQTMIMNIDSTTKENVRESIQWFHKLQSLFEDGYQGKQWRKFIYYTRAYVFEDWGCVNGGQDNILTFEWPKNLDLKPSELVFKEEMRLIVDKLVRLEDRINKTEKIKPDNKPLFFTRYIFALIFTLTLSLKLLKTYADWAKSNQL